MNDRRPAYMGKINHDVSGIPPIEGIDKLLTDAAVLSGAEVVREAHAHYFGQNIVRMYVAPPREMSNPSPLSPINDIQLV